MKHARISGILLVLTGILHTLIGAVDGYPLLGAMLREGSIGAAAASVERQMLIWFLVSGLALILLGMLALGYQKILPVSFGWGLLLLSVVGVLALGPSGFLLIVPQAVYILVVAYRRKRVQNG